LGAAAVLENKKIVGIITDGDIRRMLKNSNDFSTLIASDIMGSEPKTITSDAMAVDVLEIMESNNISQILVTENGIYAGVVHLHDLIKEGIF
jgi:arabinose-5-phosphate isomerase